LKKNYNNEMFKIIYDDNNCTTLYCTERGIILNIDEPSKSEIINNFKYLFDNDILFIGNYIYIVDPNGNNKPTEAIKKMLDYKLQPIVNIFINEYLEEENEKRIINLPSIEEKINYNNKCISDIPGHAVNLRKWHTNYIEFKNSWGSKSGYKGNFSVADLKYVSCIKTDNELNNNLEFISLMFDYYKLNESYINFDCVKLKLTNYHRTFYADTHNDTNYEGEYNIYGLFHGRGKLRYSDKKSYDSNWINGIINGDGTMTDNNGTIFKGEWKNNNFNGYGTSITTNGTIFEGEWNNNIKGKGRIIYNSDDGKYDGDYHNGINGIGKMIYTSGNIYIGYWDNYTMNGYGTMIYNNRDKYEGHWKNNKINGHGTMIYNNGDKYEGQWKYDKKYGYGTMIYNNGDNYEGQWKYDKKYGYGTMIYSNGDKYEGVWKYDKKNDYGTMIYEDGKIYEGVWNNDEYIGDK
jgi:hypothetical protein